MKHRLMRCNGLLIVELEAETLAQAVTLACRSGYSLTGLNLRGSDLSGSDLSGSDLSDSNLSDSDLSGSDLSDSNLSGSDLSGIPVIPNIDRTILSAVEGGGTLEMGNWHTCGTTHCRGGWAVHLAGEAGAALEKRIGTPAAAALIYAASRPNMALPDFYASNSEALADIRACAEAT